MSVGVGAIVDSVSTAVTSVASAVAQYGPNDEGKAVKAAKKAGNKAKQLESKKYPAWASGGKSVAKSLGIETKGEYKSFKATQEQEAYQAAYDQVWNIYEESKNAEINATNAQTAQQLLNNELAAEESSDLYASKNTTGGCAPLAALLVGGASALAWIIYEVVNLV